MQESYHQRKSKQAFGESDSQIAQIRATLNQLFPTEIPDLAFETKIEFSGGPAFLSYKIPVRNQKAPCKLRFDYLTTEDTQDLRVWLSHSVPRPTELACDREIKNPSVIQVYPQGITAVSTKQKVFRQDFVFVSFHTLDRCLLVVTPSFYQPFKVKCYPPGKRQDVLSAEEQRMLKVLTPVEEPPVQPQENYIQKNMCVFEIEKT